MWSSQFHFTYLLQSHAHFLGNNGRQRQDWQLDTGDEITEQKKYKKKSETGSKSQEKKRKSRNPETDQDTLTDFILKLRGTFIKCSVLFIEEV